MGCGRSPSGDHEDRTPTHGYEATREEAMAGLAKAGGGASKTVTDCALMDGVYSADTS